MLEKVNFKHGYYYILHTSAISKSYSTYTKVSVGLWNFDNGGSKWLFYVWLKGQISKKCSPKLLFLIKKRSALYPQNTIVSFEFLKIPSSRLSWLVAHPRIFRLFMKGNFDAYVLWPLDKMVQNWIADQFTAHNFK